MKNWQRVLLAIFGGFGASEFFYRRTKRAPLGDLWAYGIGSLTIISAVGICLGWWLAIPVLLIALLVGVGVCLSRIRRNL
jgi:CHASE2 domain-containing sensor protein